jgi:IS5 family transposase
VAGKKLTWKIAAKRGKLNAMPEGKEKTRLQAIEKAKARIRARVEHPFRVIKRQFGYTKVRFRGLAKNLVQVLTLFALSNLWMVRKQLLGSTGKLRPKYA